MTLKRYAALQGLDFPPPNFRLTHATRAFSHRPGRPRRDTDPAPYRAAWLDAIELTSGVGMNVLRQQLPRQYSWLWRYDRAWIKANTPTVARTKRPLPPVNWQQRDEAMMVSLQAAAERLRLRQNPPFRISANALLIEIGRRTFFRKNTAQLPHTAALLTSLTESHEAFAIRRVWYVAKGFHQEGSVPRRRVLAERASVDAKPNSNSPAVQAAVDAALGWLRGETDAA